MKHYLSLVASFCLFLAVSSCYADRHSVSYLHHKISFTDAPPPIKWHFGKTVVKIFFGSQLLYTIGGDITEDYTNPGGLLNLKFKVMANREEAIGNKFVRIAGSTQTIHFRSDASNVLKIYDDGSFEIKSPGVCNITITLAGKVVTLPFRVVSLPLKVGMSKVNVVNKIGLPDRRSSAFLEWPTKNYTLDGIWYSNESDDVKGLSIEHWMYNQHPYAILDFQNESLNGCLESSWDSIGLVNRSFEE